MNPAVSDRGDSVVDRHAVLIVGPSWAGDMVLAQSLCMRLRQQDSARAIDVLAPDWNVALLARMPEVRNAIVMPVGHGALALGERYRLGRRLREQHYRQAIVLPNSFKSALVPFWARIPQRTGYRGEQRYGLLNDMRQLDKTRLPMTVQRFAALADPAGSVLPVTTPQPILAVRDSDVDVALVRYRLQRPQAPLLVLCPGAAYGPAQRWPADYFAEVARAKLADGWSVWLLGSKQDRDAGAAIAAAAPGCTDLCGRTSLAEAVDLMALAAVVVSNDSGLMHIAAALDRQLVAIYGSSNPGSTPPMQPQAKILSLRLPCSPCFKRECPLGHLNCLRDLSPSRVLAAIDASLLTVR